jgi:hypothetical protein
LKMRLKCVEGCLDVDPAAFRDSASRAAEQHAYYGLARDCACVYSPVREFDLISRLHASYLRYVYGARHGGDCIKQTFKHCPYYRIIYHHRRTEW